MNNFDHAASATETAMNSAGSAAKENSRYMEGLEAKTQAVRASFEKLANSVIDSNLVKTILDLANAFLKLLDTPIGTFVTQTTLLTGVLWGGTGLIHAMQIIPAFVSKAAKGISFFNGALSLTAPHLALVAAGIAALIAIGPPIIDWLKKQNNHVYKYESALEDLNEQLSTNKSRLEELNSIPEKNRTEAIQAEIDKLKEENEELQKQIDLNNERLAGATFREEIENKTGQGEGFYIKRNARTQATLDRGDIRNLNKAGFVLDAEQALERLVEVGLVTQHQVDKILSDTTKTAEDALDELGFALQKGVGEIQGQDYYEYALDKLIALTKEFQEGGELSPDFVGSYNEYRFALQELLDKAEDVNQNELPNWFLDVREQMTNMPDVANQIADSYYNVEETIQDLNQGLQINQLQYNQLISQFPDLESALEKTANGWKANISELQNFDMAILEVSGTYQKLISGMTASESEIQKLLKVYPQLTDYIGQNSKGYYLEIEALVNSAQAGNEWASSMVRSQSGATKEAIRLTKKRVEALEAELAAMSGTSADFGKVFQQWKEVSNQLSRLENLYKASDPGKITFEPVKLPPFGGGSGSSSGGGSSTSHKTDPIAEQNKLFKEQIEIMEHKLFLMQKEGQSEEAQIGQLRAIQAELERQKQWYYSQGLDANSEYIRELEEQWWGYEDQIKDLYKEQANVYEVLFATVASKSQDEIDKLNKKKEELQKQNEELEKQIKLEEALDNLARAKQNKVLVYKDGQFQYVEDADAVSAAQKELEQTKREEELNNQLEAIDKEIEEWEDYKKAYGDVVTDYKKKQDELLLEQKLGIKLEGELWTERLDYLHTYISKYNYLLSQAGNPSVHVPRGVSTMSLNRTVSSLNIDTKSLGRMGQSNPKAMLMDTSGISNSTIKSFSIAIQNFTPNLPNVTNGEDFVNYLKNNVWRDTLQFVKV